ncbi:hypothetical protein A2333_02015 [Candidatus Wolfebacteria bacterium RIFOXYB2_FULL_49_7]|uniref:CBM-cenC domain-containing protein n=1 Tax=Candidatus Wolfebacteria bacterium RIFOXYB1_FULL_54_12 TaxID=1802559 RepID=A0A1F8DXX7_9BACT|nr:MAG: hypothetical protein A2372_03725 [Candidatus Wolfebacteria bacterium RIFOXYB1_FULL_54_12]OGM93444.1 MAG: hypothetical protein A2333_02015 [Candidatus Wolfebacteria bacterium RIFOXYB2_FULL_49_7]
MHGILRKLFTKIVISTGVAGVFLFFISGLVNKRIAVSDFSPFLGDGVAALSNFLYVWSTSFTGEYLPGNYLHLIRAVFESMGNPLLAQAMFLMTLFLIAYYGVYSIFSNYGYHPYVRYVVPFFYIFNPAFSRELINGYTGTLLIYAITPFLFISIERLYERYSFPYGFLFACIAGIMLLNMQTAFWVFLLLGLFVLYKTAPLQRNDAIKKVLLVAGFGLLGFLLNIVSLFTLFNHIGNLDKVSYLKTFQYTYASADIINLFVMLGNRGSREVDLGYFSSVPLLILFFTLFIAIVIVFVYKFKGIKNSNERIFVAYAMSSLLLLMGMLFTIKGGYFDGLIEASNPLVVSLRSPIKLFTLLAFSYIFLIGFATHYLIRFAQTHTVLRRLFPVVIISLIVLVYGGFNKHFFDRDLGYGRLIKNNSYYITEKNEKARGLIAANNQDEFLYLPFDYSVQLKLNGVNNVVKQQMGSASVSGGNNTYIQKLYADICRGDKSSLSHNKINIHYVVLDKKPTTYHQHKDINCELIDFYGTPYIWGDYDFFKSLFNDERIFYEDEDFIIYTISEDITPSVFAIQYVYGIKQSTRLSVRNMKYMGVTYYITELPEEPPAFIGKIEPLFGAFLENTEALLSNHFLQRNFYTKESGYTLYDFQPGSLSINAQSVYSSGDIGFATTSLGKSTPYLVEYFNPKYEFKNIVSNPSFENGTWQNGVRDCNNYDDLPILKAGLNSEVKTEGEYSLQLEATRHKACDYLSLPVKGGVSYSYSFDFQSPNAKTASYHIGFNNDAKTIFYDMLPIADPDVWYSFSDIIKSPHGASKITLYVYANELSGENVVNRYDNFRLTEVPDLAESYYLVKSSQNILAEPRLIGYDIVNPTKKLVHIKGATTPFFLAMSESYHDKWQLQMNDGEVNGFFRSWVPFVKPVRIADEYHYKLNGFLNSWYIDTETLCAVEKRCVQNTDGSYDIEMVIEFFPQRWFYLGLLISGTTFAGCIGYLLYDGVKRIRVRIRTKKQHGKETE